MGMLTITLAIAMLTANANQPPQGRFQIVFSPHLRSDMFMLDTHTGKVWQPVCVEVATSGPCRKMAWEPMDVLQAATSKQIVSAKD